MIESESSVATASLEEVAHKQSNELFNVVALLSATLNGLDAPDDTEPPELQRLVQMARERVRGVIRALGPYI